MVTRCHYWKEASLTNAQPSQLQAIDLRVDFFPAPSKQPASRRTTRLTTHKVADITKDVAHTARYFVQCNCACK